MSNVKKYEYNQHQIELAFTPEGLNIVSNYINDRLTAVISWEEIEEWKARACGLPPPPSSEKFFMCDCGKTMNERDFRAKTDLNSDRFQGCTKHKVHRWKVLKSPEPQAASV